MDLKKTWLCTVPIAHRGLHNDIYCENSLGAFENAIKHNYAIEIDVRIIDDGTVVVFHDERLGRLTNSDGYVCNLKAEDLPDIKLLNTSESIPTLKQTLDLIGGRVGLLIEIKNKGKVGILENKVIELLKDYKGDVAIQSFNPYSLAYFKEHAPHLLRGQLSTFFGKTDAPLLQRFMLKRLKLNKVSCPDFIAYSGEHLPNKYVAKSKLPVLAWTIISNSELERLKEHCDNVIFEKIQPLLDTAE